MMIFKFTKNLLFDSMIIFWGIFIFEMNELFEYIAKKQRISMGFNFNPRPNQKKDWVIFFRD